MYVCMYVYIYIYIVIYYATIPPAQNLPFQYGRYVFGMFSSLCSFCLLLYYCSGSIFWMCAS